VSLYKSKKQSNQYKIYCPGITRLSVQDIIGQSETAAIL